jgi:N-acyl-D-aspartate/D-glutamate deacylase
MSDTSLVIRGGTVVDGTGGDPFEADVAIADGRIVAVGRALPKGVEEIDARGKLVTPGFVDPHTHYDAQVTWGNHINPSSWHGVTTVLIGNCGVGFAPCLPEQREMLVKLMEGVEDIPEVVLTEGLPWNWQTFPQFLDALDARRYDLDVATQVPHAALRVYVMGERGADREDATEADRQRMAQLAAEGIGAGALGFSTSRTLNHKTLDGRSIPTLTAAEEELSTIAGAIGKLGKGWLQVIADFDEQIEPEFAMLRRLSERSGRPVSITVLERDSKPLEWRNLLDRIGQANADGLPMLGQVLNRPTGIMLGFEISQNPFVSCPSFSAIAQLPFAQKIAELRDPALREKLIAERNTDRTLGKRVATWERIFELGDPPNYEPSADQSVAARAARMGVEPAALAYDLLMQDGGKKILYRPLSNYAHGNLDTVREMMTHPNTLLSLGDGGAHVGVLCDASAPTYLLTHWTRDRKAGGLFPVSWAVKRLTRDNARALGLNDRGVIAPGYKADINVIDYDRLGLHAPEVVYDLPAGGRRMVQRSRGYAATIVSGVTVHREGEATGALPGRLIRGSQDAPA